MEVGGINIGPEGKEEAGDGMLGGGTGEGEGGGACLGMDWGIFASVYCRESLFYSAVARLHSGMQGRDGVSLQ